MGRPIKWFCPSERELLQDYCLDKQLVKEAFHKHLDVMMMLPVNRKMLSDFYDELELGK